MFTWRFWRETLERSVKTAAEVPIVAGLVGDGMLNAFTMDWGLLGGLTAGGFISGVLMCLATLKIGATDSPSAIS